MLELKMKMNTCKKEEEYLEGRKNGWNSPW